MGEGWLAGLIIFIALENMILQSKYRILQIGRVTEVRRLLLSVD